MREKLALAKKNQQPSVVLNSFEDFIKLLIDGSRPMNERRLNPTQKELIEFPDDLARFKAYMGPAGCAKTTTIACAAMLRALFQPGSRGLVARHDYNDLMGTTKIVMEDMLSRLPQDILLDRNKSSPEKWYLKPIPMEGPDGKVDDTPSEIWFMGLKESLGSFDFNWAALDEADEIDIRRVHEVNTRMRRPGGNYVIWLAFNPPDKHHELYTACTGFDFQDRKVCDPWMKLFRPHPKENQRNLPSDYYERMTAHLPQDMLQRLRDGEWGSTFEGAPVFREFKYEHHVKDELDWDGHATVVRSWDFGYNRPYMCVGFVDWLGRYKIVFEVLGNKEEARAFARRCKAECEVRFPGARYVDFGDPAVVQKKDTGQTLAEFLKEGIQIRFKKSEIEPGLRLMRQRLSLMIDGEPAMQYKRKGVPILISAMRGGYHLDDKGEKPVKDGYYDHPVDGHRYGVINLFGDGMATETPLNSFRLNLHNLPTSIARKR